MPLADLLAWERELARVQGEIESAESILRALSVRAGMIAVAVAYEGARDGWLPDGIAPIEDAVNGGLALSVNSLAEAISFVMVALPWLPIVAGGWLLLNWAARRGRGRTAAAVAVDGVVAAAAGDDVDGQRRLRASRRPEHRR